MTQNQVPLAGTVYINLSAEINVQTTETVIATMGQCANSGVTEVYLLLATPGGDVMSGINLYNVLRAMPFKLIVHNAGNVDSIGNAVFLAGDKRYAAPHSTFMFHGVGLDTTGPMRFEERLLLESLDSVQAHQKRIADIMAERSDLTADEAHKLFLETRTKDADYAADVGIIDEIRNINIPAGAPIISLVFPR